MFSREEVYGIIDKFLSEPQNNGRYTFPDSDRPKLYQTYRNLMSENVNKDKTVWEQESLITDIILGRNSLRDGDQPESWDRIYNDHSDNKHLSYFDYALGEGERDRIINALAKNGISTEVLKVIRRNMDFDSPDSSNPSVHQKMGQTENGSPQVEEFWVEYNGKRIYEFSRTRDIIRTTRSNDVQYMIDNLYDNAEDYSDSQKTRFRRKINTPYGKQIEDYYVTKSGNVAKTRQGFYTDKNGKRRFGFIKGGGIV